MKKNKASVSFRIDKNARNELRRLVSHEERIGEIIESLIREEINRRKKLEVD